jgi:hypothetical protein
MKRVLITQALDVILLGQLGAEIATGQQARRAQPSWRGPFPRDGAFLPRSVKSRYLRMSEIFPIVSSYARRRYRRRTAHARLKV